MFIIASIFIILLLGAVGFMFYLFDDDYFD